MEDVENDHVVGVFSLAPIEDTEYGEGYDLGISIFAEYQRLGWATVSLLAFDHWWRGSQQGCSVLMATISQDNPELARVHRLLIKAGFVDLHGGSYYLSQWFIGKQAGDAVGKLAEILQVARDEHSLDENTIEVMEFLHERICGYLDHRTVTPEWAEERTLEKLSDTYPTSEANRDVEFADTVDRLSGFRADLAAAEADKLFSEWVEAIHNLKEEFGLR